MFKKSILKSVSMDNIRYDHTFIQIFKTTINPRYFSKAVEYFSHYTNPVGYERNGYTYLLSHKPSIDTVIELEHNDMLVEIIDIQDVDIVLFLIIFLSKEHKELRCTAELLKVMLVYISTSEGKKWFETVSESQDKEVRLATILGISCHSVKCYLKLIQPGNEKYLELLSDLTNYSLSKAYNECRAAERHPIDPADEQAGSGSGERSSGPRVDVDPSNEVDPDFDPSEVRTPAEDFSTEEENIDDGDYLGYLEQYKLTDDSTKEADRPAKHFAQKVIVVLDDGSQLELLGRIILAVDGNTIDSTEKLSKQPDGRWVLPKHSLLLLTVSSEVSSTSNS